MIARRPSLRALAPRRPSLWRILWAIAGMLLLATCTAIYSIIRGEQ